MRKVPSREALRGHIQNYQGGPGTEVGRKKAKGQSLNSQSPRVFPWAAVVGPLYGSRCCTWYIIGMYWVQIRGPY